jgi:4-amino-4-deoxy-L-arabinose transferase-like glycosyltransferase
MPAGTAEKLDSYAATPEEGGPRWYALAAVGLAALLFLARLGVRALWASEGRWAEVVREMVLNSNYFWPTINGKLYYDKPLLSYWFIVAATYLTGGVNETATRLPSAVFGLAGVILIVVLARRLYDRTTAALAGFILATSFSYVFYSRHASADIETTTGVLAALVLFVCNRQRQDGWWVVWLWLIMAVTSLTKGLMGFALPLTVMGLYSLLEQGPTVWFARLTSGPISARWIWMRDRLRWLLNYKTPLAIIAAGALYYVPFAVSAGRSHSEAGLYMVFRENVVRFFKPFDHRGPAYLYLYVLFALMLPWSVFIPAALLEVHRKVRSTVARTWAHADLFALVYFWGTLAFFTISRSRRTYYLLPILPAAALVVARLLSQRTGELWAPARRLMKVGYGLLAVAVIGFGIGYLMPDSVRPGALKVLPPSPGWMIFLAGWLICIGMIWYTWHQASARRIAISTAVIAYLSLFFLFMVMMPEAEAYRYERSFARAVRTNIGDHADRLALFRIWGPGLVYYLSMPNPIPLFNSSEQVAGFAHDKGGAWLISRARDVQDLNMSTEMRAAEPELPWDSRSENVSRYVLLKVR